MTNEDALIFLLKHPDIRKKCMESVGNYQHSLSDEDKEAMEQEWKAARELYLSEKLQQLDKAWEACLGVAVS